MDLYSRMMPKPNQNFIENGQQPINNFYRGGEPDSPKSQQYGFRLDFNASSKDRFFFRTSGITFLEYVSDWTYAATDPALRIHSADRSRYQWSYTGTWTRAMGTTVLDSSFATNRFNQIDEFRGLKQYKPTDVGLPAYLDEFCSTRGGCTLPSIDHRRLPAVWRRIVRRRYRDAHAGAVHDHLREGAAHAARRRRRPARAARPHRRRQPIGPAQLRSHLHAAVQRRGDADAEQPRSVAGRLRARPADLGVDQRHRCRRASATTGWGRSRRTRGVWAGFTLNAGLRFEYETGVREKDGQMIVGFDPTARLAITDAAQAAYLASGLQNQPGMPATLTVLGGPIYANDAGQSGAAYGGKAMWMPRASASYLIGDRTVLKGGYGLYYDTLNAADYVAAQAGYSVTTTSTISDDLGRTFKWATPATGASELRSVPGPRRRYPLGPGGRRRARRQLAAGRSAQHGERPARARPAAALARVAPAGALVESRRRGRLRRRLQRRAPGDHPRRTTCRSSTWDGSNTRNTAANTYLTAQVPNPYFINNFAFLRTTDPVLYQRLASNPTFSSATIQRNRLLRPFGHMTALTLLQPAARRVEVAFARGAGESPVQQRAHRLPVVQRQPRALQPHRRGVRARADALAGEQRRTSLASGRSRPATSCRSAAAGSSWRTVACWRRSRATGR